MSEWRARPDEASIRAGARRAAGALAMLGALAASIAPGWAAGLSEPPGCTADGGERVVLEGVNSDVSLRLADGRVVRLAGIDPVVDTAAHPALTAETVARVGAWLVGRTATLRVLVETPDRWGRVSGLVFVDPASDAAGTPPLSAAYALVDAGLARARPEPLVHPCWAALRDAEAGARMARLGLWADPYYAVRDAADGAALAAMAGSMVVVEGRVVHVGRTRSQIYLDLGPDRAALTLRIGLRDAFILGQAGLGDKDWVGRLLRARGDLDDELRPRIDIRDGDQIEVLGEPGATVVP